MLEELWTIGHAAVEDLVSATGAAPAGSAGCAARADASCDLGHVPARELLPAPTSSSTRERAALPAPRVRLRRVLPRAARRVRVAGGHLQRLRLLLVVLRLLARARSRATSSEMIERFGLGAASRASSRSPATTATCSSTSRARRAGARHRAGGQRRRGGGGAGHSDARPRSSGPRLARDLVGEGRRADLLVGNNVLAHVPDLNDFVARHDAAARARRRRHHGVPAPPAPDRGDQFDTIYHEHFSYFSLAHASSASSPRTACASSTSRSCRRTAGRCGSTRATPRTTVARRRPGASRSSLERERAAGLDRPRGVRAFPRAGARTCAHGLRVFLVEAPGARAHRRGLRRAGEGQHAPELLRGRPRPRRLRRRPQPAQAGPLPARHPASRSARPSTSRETKPDYLLSCPWNLKDEIMEQMRDIREWGGRFVTPIPEVAVHE